MNQYPEDIRNYDNDPRSPFCDVEEEEEECLEIEWKEEEDE